MNIYTAHWKHYSDDYYAPHNKRMFLYREDAYKFLDDLINYDGIDQYCILEETVFDQYSPMSDYDDDDYDDGYCNDYDEIEFENNNPYYYFSDIDRHALETRDLIEEQFQDAHNSLHFTRGLGKDVMNIDNYWFTSDEIEAFREIWQRRLSAI